MEDKINKIWYQMNMKEITSEQAHQQVLDLFAVVQRSEQLAISALKNISENEREQFSSWEAKNTLKEIANCA